MAIADPDQFLIDWQRLVQNQLDALIDQQRHALAEESPDGISPEQRVARVLSRSAGVLQALGLPMADPPEDNSGRIYS